MEVPGIKFDDGSGGFSSNCFPVRNILRRTDDGGGAWVVSHQAEQRRRFKAVLCANHVTYEQIKDHRKQLKQSSRDHTSFIIPPPASVEEQQSEDEEKILDGFFLMKHCCVEDPSDLCSVNVSSQGLVDAKEKDLLLFDNVAYVNAADNLLPFEAFKYFPIIRELEISVNALRSLQISPGDFQHLEMLDVSFNNMSEADILSLGLLPSLKILHLTGNGIYNLPTDMAQPYTPSDSFRKVPRYPKLEILLLDDNRLADMTLFSALAGLKSLRHLNLSKNHIFTVPQLLVLEGRHVTQETPYRAESHCSGKKSARSGFYSSRSGHKSGRASRKSKEAPRQQGVQSQESQHLMKMQEQAGSPNQANLTPIFNTPDVSQQENMVMTEEVKKIDLDEINRKIVEEMTKPTDNTQKDCVTVGALQHLPPPFPELVHLDLSYNKIYDEDSLLALAAWPMLSELIIHNNPLTTEFSGDPPLVKTYLADRLGIHIVRKKPGLPHKPIVEVKALPDRMVESTIPKVPKRDIEEVVKAIEAAIHPALPAITSSPEPGSKLETRTPIPPIHSPVKASETEQKHVAESNETTQSPQEGKLSQDSAAFFMTQVDDQQEEKTAEAESQSEVQSKPRERKGGARKKSVKPGIPAEYSILYDEDDSEGLPGKDDITHTGVNSKVRALQHMLKHPLLYQDKETELHKPQAAFHPLHKKPTPPPVPRKSKHEQVGHVLKNLRDRPTLQEASLVEVLETRNRTKRTNFPEAAKLLQDVQEKYNTVRTASMKEARQVRDHSQYMLAKAESLTAT